MKSLSEWKVYPNETGVSPNETSIWTESIATNSRFTQIKTIQLNNVCRKMDFVYKIKSYSFGTDGAP